MGEYLLILFFTIILSIIFNYIAVYLANKFDLIDAQQSTDHLKSLGAFEMPRVDFLTLLNKSLKKGTHRGKWGNELL